MFPRIRTVALIVTTICLIVGSIAILLLAKNVDSFSNSISSKDPEDGRRETVDEATISPESLRHFYQRGKYMVLADFIVGSKPVTQTYDVTYATQSTVDYLDNVKLLVEFWEGFISVAIYAPGTEVKNTLLKIARLRQCHGKIGQEVSRRVSFHLFFDEDHAPKPTFRNLSGGLLQLKLPIINQSLCGPEYLPRVKSSKKNKTATPRPGGNTGYRQKYGLFYPINMARNIARERSRTHFVLVSDIELYPNPKSLIPEFLALVRKMSGDDPEFGSRRQVFVLPPFELKWSVNKSEIPKNKNQLVNLLRKGRAIPFHKYPCRPCHKIPNETAWINASTDRKLGIFGTTLYFGIKAWEPFYIGTHADPPFDERIYREFSLNKPVQISAMCHLDYKFHILDNAFLVHKPGIRMGRAFWNYSGKAQVYNFSKTSVIPLQQELYGKNKRCSF